MESRTIFLCFMYVPFFIMFSVTGPSMCHLCCRYFGSHPPSRVMLEHGCFNAPFLSRRDANVQICARRGAIGVYDCVSATALAVRTCLRAEPVTPVTPKAKKPCGVGRRVLDNLTRGAVGHRDRFRSKLNHLFAFFVDRSR